MKKIYTLILLLTLTSFLSGNQVVITQNYNFIVSEGKGYGFNNGNSLSNTKYERTNKIEIVNNKVLADPLKYHYAFFWDEADTYLGYYKTNKGINTSGTYLGQVNTQSIPLPLNAYSFALVRYDNDYELVAGLSIEDIFLDSDNYFSNTIDWNSLNTQTLNEVFESGNLFDNFQIVSGRLDVLSYDSDSITLQLETNQNLDLTNNAIIFNLDKPNFATLNTIDLGTIDQNSFVSLIDTQSALKYYVSTEFILPYNTSIRYVSVATDFRWRFVLNENDIFTLANIKFISLTNLGIDTLTKTNIDNFYFLYDNVKENNFDYVGYSTIFVNPTFAYDEKILNLTAIFGAGNEPDETTMNGYYAAYEEYLEYLYVCCTVFENQTISYEVYYFNDGVSTEIEQLGSILIFTLIGFTLMIFGFVSRRRLFNLLAVGAFVVLGFLLIEFVGFIIILFGLIFINVYYTFFGEL